MGEHDESAAGQASGAASAGGGRTEAGGWAAPGGPPSPPEPPPAQPAAPPPGQPAPPVGQAAPSAGWAPAPPGGWADPSGPQPGPQPDPQPGTQPGPLPGQPATGWGSQPHQARAAPVLRPGIVPLRPLSLGEIYDGAFQALRANPRAMLGVTAVVVTVISLVDVATTLLAADGLAAAFSLTEPGREITPADVDTLLGSAEVLGFGAAVSLLAWVVGLAVVTGLLTVAVSQAVLGRRVSLDQLWRRTRPRLLPLIGVALLLMLLLVSALVLTVLLVVMGAVVAPVAGVVMFVIALPALLAGWGLVLGRLSLVPPILLLEEQRLFAAFARSWRLTRSSSWRVLGIVLLTLIIVLVTGALVSAPFAGVSIAISVTAGEADVATALGLSAPQLVIAAVGDIVSRTIVYPFFAGAVALLYIDLRMRREGLDVQLARAAAEGPPPDGPNSA